MNFEAERRRFESFLEKFSDAAVYATFRKLRWGELRSGKCPRCGSIAVQHDRRGGVVEHFRCLSRNREAVSTYRPHEKVLVFTLRTDTILENSHLPLHYWAYCLALYELEGNSISPTHLANVLGVTRKTASAILRRMSKAHSETDKVGADAFLLMAGTHYANELARL